MGQGGHGLSRNQLFLVEHQLSLRGAQKACSLFALR